METKDIRDTAQKHYDDLFELMHCHEGKRKEGIKPPSWRPRVHPDDIELALGEVEGFLTKHHPKVRIPSRPAILQRVPCRSSF